MEPTFPMEEGPGLKLRQENRGLKGLQGCDRDTWPEWQGPWRPRNCPGHLPKAVPLSRAAVLLIGTAHRDSGSSRVQCVGE